MERKLKIIVADDIEILAKNIALVLQENPNVEMVEIVNNGKEELDKILKILPDIVFTDFRMPEMTGIEVIEEVKNLNLAKKPQFILVTSDRGSDIITKSIDLEFSIEYKPIDSKRINQYIEDYMFFLEKRNIEMNNNIQNNDAKKENFLKRLFKIKNKV